VFIFKTSEQDKSPGFFYGTDGDRLVLPKQLRSLVSHRNKEFQIDVYRSENLMMLCCHSASMS